MCDVPDFDLVRLGLFTEEQYLNEEEEEEEKKSSDDSVTNIDMKERGLMFQEYAIETDIE